MSLLDLIRLQRSEVDEWIPSEPPVGQETKSINDSIFCRPTPREMLLGTVSIPYDNARRRRAPMAAS